MELRNFVNLFLRFSCMRAVLTSCSSECGFSYASDCQAYQENGHHTSGIYHITPVGMFNGYDVFCDMTTDGGGWLVFQRRVDGSLDFQKNWTDYEFGFGNVSHEHWLGFKLKWIQPRGNCTLSWPFEHGLLPLKRILSQGHYEIRFDLEDFDNNTRFAKYNLFTIGDRRDNYTLTIGRYSGNAGNAMDHHDGVMFTTPDRDNDEDPAENCAKKYSGAWWYRSCHYVNLNGLYLNGNYTTPASSGVCWKQWKGYDYSLKVTEIKIRRA